MNPAEIVWIVPPEEQGQIVEFAYSRGYADVGYRRITDRSDNTVRYQMANFAWHDAWPERWEPWNCSPVLPSGVTWESL